MNSCARGLVALALAMFPLVTYSDSSYRETTQITGGQLLDWLKNTPLSIEQVRQWIDPAIVTTLVHGNQKAVVTSQSTEIYDLDKQLIIHIDPARKKFSIDTFADVRKIIAANPGAMIPPPPPPASADNLQYSFSLSVNDTGLRQTVNGLAAAQRILRLTANVTDPTHPGAVATWIVTSEIWTTPGVPQPVSDAQDFDARLARALTAGAGLPASLNLRGHSPGAALSPLLAGSPGAAEALAQMGRELAKIDGVPVLVKTSIAGAGTVVANPAIAAGNSAGGNLVARAVTGLRGKPKSQPAAAAPPAGPANSPPPSGETTLLETTSQIYGFSHDPLPASAFQVPRGFKQVPSPLAETPPGK